MLEFIHYFTIYPNVFTHMLVIAALLADVDLPVLLRLRLAPPHMATRARMMVMIRLFMMSYSFSNGSNVCFLGVLFPSRLVQPIASQ